MGEMEDKMIKITSRGLIGRIKYHLKKQWLADDELKTLSIYDAEYINTSTNDSGITRLIEFEDNKQSETFNEDTLFPVGLDDERKGPEIMDDFDITEEGLKIVSGDYFTLQDWINININCNEKIEIDGFEY